MTATIIAENGRKLKPHDGCTEWSVCGKCGESIDWAADCFAGTDDEDTTCPHCGHGDTAYLYVDENRYVQVATYDEAVAELDSQTEDGPIVLDPNGDSFFPTEKAAYS